MMFIKTVLFLSSLILSTMVEARDCIPSFYTQLPRDSSWHYGAGRGKDAVAARGAAVEALAVQAVGPGATALPPGALSGWEPDDSAKCNDTFYALVRIEKDRVADYFRNERKAKREIADRLDGRVAAVETETTRLNHSEAKNAAELRKSSERYESLAMRLSDSETKSKSGDDRDGYVPANIKELHKEKLEPRIRASLKRIDAGAFATSDVAMVLVGFSTMKRHKDLKAFCRRILGPKVSLDFQPGLRLYVTEKCTRSEKAQ